MAVVVVVVDIEVIVIVALEFVVSVVARLKENKWL